ncbi:hypothetical protein BD770DRAFT_450948 [Pilaira anomala]|nr:hypothetical protein BD770DRAFT_450948 [Pilaira anomala]
MARIFNIDIGQDASKYGVNISPPKKQLNLSVKKAVYGTNKIVTVEISVGAPLRTFKDYRSIIQVKSNEEVFLFICAIFFVYNSIIIAETRRYLESSGHNVYQSRIMRAVGDIFSSSHCHYTGNGIVGPMRKDDDRKSVRISRMPRLRQHIKIYTSKEYVGAHWISSRTLVQRNMIFFFCFVLRYFTYAGESFN